VQNPTVKLDVCPKNAKYNIKSCTEPRPTLENCPFVVYIREPDPLYCGVRADGSRINFAV
jgi:hypothetical protein